VGLKPEATTEGAASGEQLNAEDRRVVGCVRTETMMHTVLQELAHLAQA